MKMLLALVALLAMASTAQAQGGVTWGVQRGNRTAYVQQRGNRRVYSASVRRGNVTYHRAWDGRKWHTAVTVQDRYGRFVTMQR